MRDNIKYVQIGLFDDEIEKQKEQEKINSIFTDLNDSIKNYNHDINIVNSPKDNKYAKPYHFFLASNILINGAIISLCIYQKNINNLHFIALAISNISCLGVATLYHDRQDCIDNIQCFYQTQAGIKRGKINNCINILKSSDISKERFNEEYGNSYFDRDNHFINNKTLVKR